jgi:hypothetical protein
MTRIVAAVSLLAHFALGSLAWAHSEPETPGATSGSSSAWVQSLLRQREAADRHDRSLQQLREDFARDEIQRKQRALELDEKQLLRKSTRPALSGEARPRLLIYDTTPELQRQARRRSALSEIRLAEDQLRTDQILYDQASRHDRERFARRTESLLRRDLLNANAVRARRELRGYRARQSLENHLIDVNRFVNGR